MRAYLSVALFLLVLSSVPAAASSSDLDLLRGKWKVVDAASQNWPSHPWECWKGQVTLEYNPMKPSFWSNLLSRTPVPGKMGEGTITESWPTPFAPLWDTKRRNSSQKNFRLYEINGVKIVQITRPEDGYSKSGPYRFLDANHLEYCTRAKAWIPLDFQRVVDLDLDRDDFAECARLERYDFNPRWDEPTPNASTVPTVTNSSATNPSPSTAPATLTPIVPPPQNPPAKAGTVVKTTIASPSVAPKPTMPVVQPVHNRAPSSVRRSFSAPPTEPSIPKEGDIKPIIPNAPRLLD